MVRDRWVFVTFVVLWLLVAILDIFLIIRDLRNHVPFGFGSWAGPLALVMLAITLVRAGRLRRKAAQRR